MELLMRILSQLSQWDSQPRAFWFICYSLTLLLGMKKKKTKVWYAAAILLILFPLYWPFVRALMDFDLRFWGIYFERIYLTSSLVGSISSFIHVLGIRIIFRPVHRMKSVICKRMIYVSFPFFYYIYSMFAIGIMLLVVMASNWILSYIIPNFSVSWIIINT